MSLNFDVAQVLELSKNHRVVPVIDTHFAGNETPLSVFEKLAAAKPGSFLLESAEQGVWSRYSFIGVTNRGTLEFDGQSVHWKSASGSAALPDGSDLSDDALVALEQLVQAWTSNEIASLPPLTSGLVGLIGWDMIRELEKLPNRPMADFEAPVMALAMFNDLVIFDHQTAEISLVSNIFVEDETDVNAAYALALESLEQMKLGLSKPIANQLIDYDLKSPLEPSHRVEKSDFIESIEKAKHYVRIGDVFQVVLAQRFDLPTEASPLEIYRVLRALNPSPYMYLLNFEDDHGSYAVIGSSPEALVKVEQGHAITHPIAGSRPRGETESQDSALAKSLIEDAKERAEHLMLVDLARNDLLKVCEPSSVTVTEFMQIHRFSHIMHLVSTVEGEVRQDQSTVDVFKATFPAGTLSGAPKPRALEIIDELEPSNRGIYGGVVGYFDFSGNADLAIAIRTAYVRDGIARVSAGAGLVLDSVPESEYQETIAKAGAPLRAVLAASQGR